VRVGAVDCGTNSIRLLIADIDPATRAVRDVVRELRVVRLGAGVERTGRLDPARIAAALAAAREYADRCRAHDVEAVRFVATSASRDAANAGDFVAGVAAAFRDFGIGPEVITGADEARLSFDGATGDVRAAGIPGPHLVVDIGGGSTEFVRGAASIESAVSLDIGCVRLTERHLLADPSPSDTPAGTPDPPLGTPTGAMTDAMADAMPDAMVEGLAAAWSDAATAVTRAADVVSFAGLGALVGLAGTVTTVTAHARRLAAYDPKQIHLAILTPAATIAACTELTRMDRTERAALPYMHPGRVDVIAAGALIWRAVVEAVVAASGPVPVVTSEHDILDGIALSLVP
jgi:exopolyphosphatase/guanosine-5'-triphosphate,3'-diphosphate pyrophosphatase